MKFATLKDGSRDGKLVVVSKALSHAAPIPEIAPTLQALLDNWEKLVPAAEEVYARLNGGDVDDAITFQEEHSWCSPAEHTEAVAASY